MALKVIGSSALGGPVSSLQVTQKLVSAIVLVDKGFVGGCL